MTRRALLAACVLLSACSALVSPDRVQCHTSDDCAQVHLDGGTRAQCREGLCLPKIGPNWACIGGITPDARHNSQAFDLQYQFLDTVTHNPYVGLTIDVCPASPLDCTTPLQSLSTDAMGLATISVPQHFDGFLTYSATGALPSQVHLLWELWRRASAATAGPLGFGVSSLSTFQILSQIAQTVYMLDVMPGNAFLAIASHDCDLDPAAGVTFVVTPMSDHIAIGYVRDTAVAFNVNTTDVSGGAIFLNIPPGMITLSAVETSTGRMVAEPLTILARADELALVELGP